MQIEITSSQRANHSARVTLRADLDVDVAAAMCCEFNTGGAPLGLRTLILRTLNRRRAPCVSSAISAPSALNPDVEPAETLRFYDLAVTTASPDPSDPD